MKNKSEIILGDCLNKLKKIKTGSYDHCITDPPYNISNYEGKKKLDGTNQILLGKRIKNLSKLTKSGTVFQKMTTTILL